MNSKAHEEQARRILRRVGVDLSRVEFFRFPTNRGWTRDFGPMFVKRDARERAPDVAIVDFGFNGWAKYPNWQKDNKVASLAAARARSPVVSGQGEEAATSCSRAEALMGTGAERC